MSYSLTSLKWVHRGLYMGVSKVLLRGMLGVQTIAPLNPIVCGFLEGGCS